MSPILALCPLPSSPRPPPLACFTCWVKPDLPKVAAPLSILSSNACRFQFLHILAKTYRLSGLLVLCQYYVSVLRPVPHCNDYCRFVVSFQLRKYEPSNFVLFEDRFGYPEYRFHENFKARARRCTTSAHPSLSVSETKIAGILIGLVLNL